VEVLLNVHSLFLIRKEVLEAPRLGSFNLHPRPLPRRAGLNSVCRAIYRDETEHGITSHKLVPEIDAGPIVYQECIGVVGEENGLSVTVKCVKIEVPLILRLLKRLRKDQHTFDPAGYEQAGVFRSRASKS
jgi:methionyl-tRNA formyltransferase